MTTRTVPLEVLDALAHGGDDTGGVLRAAQRSKRLLVVHELMATARARAPHLVVEGGLDRAYDTLVDVHRHARHAVDEVLLQPHVGAWAMHCLRLLTRGDAGPADLADLGHLGAVAAAAALRAGRRFDVGARLGEGRTLMLPTYGLARLPIDGGWCRIRSDGGGEVEIVTPAGRVGIRVETGATSPETGSTWLPLRRLHSMAGGLSFDVRVDDIDPFRRCFQQPLMDRLGDDAVEDWQVKLDDAWKLLVEHHRAQAEAIARTVLVCVPLRPTEMAPELSATSRDALGAVAMTPPRNPMAMALALVHEWRHNALYQLADLVALDEGSPEKRFYSPWRRDPRPASGLVHGAYAFLGLSEFWDVHRRHRGGDRRSQRRASFEFALSRHQVATALEDLQALAGLTPSGVRLVEVMRRRLATLRRRRVPAEIGSLAEVACRDHATSWRLRNVRPESDQVEAWADAWSSGRPCPWLGEPRAVVVDGSGPMPSAARLALVRRGLADPAGTLVHAPAATRGDLRLADGDVAGAMHAYRAQIRRDPGDLASWAGLALARHVEPSGATGPLTAFPEVVRAVHHAARDTGGDVPDPEEIAAWLAGGLPRARGG